MYWLSIWLLLGVEVVHGPDSDGWAPRQQPSYEICQERKEFLLDHWKPYLIEHGIATDVIVKCTRYRPE